MSRRSFAYLTAGSLALPFAATSLDAQTNSSATFVEEAPRYSANQLDNLVGPIALYPDALLAQVLVAATFPDQVEDAARYVRANGTNGIDDQSWDVSVKAVAHYASALNTLADKLDWTTTLGTAYANQSSDVMASVQRMRALAAQHGNLVSNTQQQVIQQGPNYVITPAQPRVIYVPVYDPIVVYSRPIFGVGFSSRYWSYGLGFPIGGWLSYDLDWGMRRVYYNGWDAAYYEFGGGWRARSRPFISITNVYVSPRYRTVYVNRDVWRRPINYGNVDRFGGYHRDTYFAGRRDGYRDGYRDGRDNDGGRVGRDNDGRDRDDRSSPRTAQPRADGGRDERTVVTPDGYRRVAGTRDETPRDRRSEPSVSANAVSIAPEYVRNEASRTAERRSDERVDGSDRPERRDRGDQPRIAMPQTPPIVTPPPQELPRATPRQAYPSDMPRRTSNPRDEARQAPPRETQPRQAAPRAAQPRESQPRESQPRVSAPRSGGGESRQASPRSANPRGGR
ncbi:MAG: DUF3300 domain-containing protein [Gemmatimonadaceae bacterium]|nr:DUF3300 domain-containing protein [Gemmatimonadaceae bacterium]